MTILPVTAADLEAWMIDGAELALLDVREAGQIGEGHILFSAPAPYSRFEILLPRLAPNPGVRMVLCDDGDGVAARAADRAASMGYAHVHILEGGVAAWAKLGRTLFKGVNVPSKAFGELVEHVCDTPRLSAEEVRNRNAEMVLLDGRPAAEYHRMTIPGARNCPNGELALRIGTEAPNPAMPVVINCAGRTRSIIGAQTLRDLDVPNPVYALENGTQGWTLAGLDLARGETPALAAPIAGEALQDGRERAIALAERHGADMVEAEDAAAWIEEPDRTTFLLDIRTADEQEAPPPHGAVHAPGGQLIQATDQWIGVRNARVVVMDDEEVRAPVVASWLARLGHETYWLSGGTAEWRQVAHATPVEPAMPTLRGIAPDEVTADAWTVLDLRASAAFREGHVPGARWATRARLARASGLGAHCLVSDDPLQAALAAQDLREIGIDEIVILDGGMDAWREAGLPIEASPDQPPDAERIDYLFFVHDRHDGNLDASRAYLAWETGLVAQLDPRERAVFKI